MPFESAHLGPPRSIVVLIEEPVGIQGVSLRERLKCFLHAPRVGVLLVGVPLAHGVVAMPLGVGPCRHGVLATSLGQLQFPGQAPGIRRRYARDGQTRQQRNHDRGRDGRAMPRPFPASLRRGQRPGLGHLALQDAPQVRGQPCRRRIATGRVLVQAFQADRLQVARDMRRQFARSEWLVADDFAQRVGVACAAKGRLPGEQLVQDRSQPVYVGRRDHVRHAPFGLLGGHIGGRAHHQPGASLIPCEISESSPARNPRSSE